MRKAAFFIAAVLMCAAPAAALEKILEVTTGETVLSREPGAGEIDARLFRGQRVRALEEKDGWYRVALRNGVEGWVAGWLAREAPAPAAVPPGFGEDFRVAAGAPVYGVVIAEAATVRNTPYGGLQAKRDATRWGEAVKGTAVRITDAVFHWLRVELSPWEWGWVYDEALRPLGAEEAPPRPSAVLSVEHFSGDRSRRLEFGIERPVPFAARASVEPGLVWFRLYGIECEGLPDEFFAVSYTTPGADLQCDVPSSTLSGVVYAFGAPTGYSAEMSGSKFALDVKTGFAVPPLVVLDPGHGEPPPHRKGYREGAHSPDGKLHEADLVLDVARRTRRVLEEAGIRVMMTREGNTDAMMDLTRRVEFADAAGADLFVSIHLNGDTDKSRSGAEVYWYDPISRRLAEAIVRRIGSGDGRGPGETVFASFAVIRQTRRPAVLVEGAYLTNPAEAALLAQESFRGKLAEGIAGGIMEFMGR
ncbi:MAG: N-acetylmuramoyl-L-alanine amidase [bacterium]